MSKKKDENVEHSGSDIEEADIEALARSRLKPGERILGEGSKVAESRGICNAPVILQKLQDIEYKVPEGAKRVPWIDTLTIDGQREVPKNVKPKDGVKLEGTFADIAADAVREAYRRLRVMRIPCSRPSDFYAEMLRTDSTMYKVRARAAEENRRIRIVEDRKKGQAAKKFAKKARTHKLEARAEDKRQTLDDINAWRAKSKRDRRNADDQDLEDILDRNAGAKREREDEDEGGQQGGKKKQKKSWKRQQKDLRWGHGGKKKRNKQNDFSSVNDISRSPWAKGKGKGSGKGLGKGKGKGKGKGFSGAAQASAADRKRRRQK